MIKKCVIFSSYEGRPLVHLPEEGSVREVVSRRLNRNCLPILQMGIDTVCSIIRRNHPSLSSIQVTKMVMNVDINLETEYDLRHLSPSCNDFHKYVLKIVSAAQ
jgi:hypothetical protein